MSSDTTQTDTDPIAPNTSADEATQNGAVEGAEQNGDMEGATKNGDIEGAKKNGDMEGATQNDAEGDSDNPNEGEVPPGQTSGDDGGTQTAGDKIENTEDQMDTDTTTVEPETETPDGAMQENGVEEDEKPKPDDVDSDSEDIPTKLDEVPPHDTQRSEIQTLLSKSLQTGQKWYLVHIRWFKQWKRYVGYDNWDRNNAGDEIARPGPIDNTSLLDQAKLRRHQVDEIDYKLVPEEAWRKLASWYGLSPDSLPISRRVVEYGKFVKQCKVEIYPLELKACLYPKESDFKIVRISRCDTIRVLEKKMRKVFEIEANKEVRIHNRYMTYTYELIKDPAQEAQDVGLFDGQCVLMEVQNQDASWPRTNQATRSMQTNSYSGASQGVTTRSHASSHSSSGYSDTYRYSSNYDYYSGRRPSVPGLCGLSNLGNTCFMNSGLQCLVHIPSLIEYFTTGKYLNEINKDNPLGMRGELAKSFGELVKAMWSGDYAYLAPRDYKHTVGKFAPTFSGYAQQDSQEHISFLLDGLHEDLNRVLKKPYCEMTEITKPDIEAAEESWKRHQMRNKSVIVDTFQGQYKSTLVCPDCDKVSITFDPFMYLSLPLPIKKTRNVKLTLISLDPEKKPIYFKVKVPKNGRISELCQELSVLSGVDSDHMFVCDVYSHRFHKIFDHNESVNGITERDDIFVYETPISTIDDPDIMCLPVYNRELRRTQYTSIGTHSYVHHYLFGLPLILPLPRDKTTYRDVYKICLYFMKRYIEIPEEFRGVFGKDRKVPTGDDVEMDNNESSSDSDEPDREKGSGGDAGEDSNGKEDKNSENVDGNSENTERNSEVNVDNRETAENTEMTEGKDGDEIVKSKLEVEEPETTVEMEVDGAAGPVTSNGFVPDNFDISQFPPDLFKLKLVNAYGSAEMGDLKDDGQVLRLMNRSVIALEWNPKYRQFYNDSELKNIQEDESLFRKEIKKEIHLADCIKLFTEKETLSENDPWYCPQCKDFRQASKQLELWKLPECIVIHLKRFTYTQYWRDKLDTFINFPLELDMTDYTLLKTQGSLHYELYGVSNHFGGLGGGHYTAYAKQKDTGNWHYFDDSSVTSHQQNESVVTKAGYLLFYVKKTCVPLVTPSEKKNSDAAENDPEGDPEDMPTD